MTLESDDFIGCDHRVQTTVQSALSFPKSQWGSRKHHQKEVAGSHRLSFHNTAPQTQRKIHLFFYVTDCVPVPKLLFLFVCVCVLGMGMFVILWKNRNLTSSEHANLLFCFAQLTLSTGQDWSHEENRVSCHECRILSTVNVVFHFLWELLSIW